MEDPSTTRTNHSQTSWKNQIIFVWLEYLHYEMFKEPLQSSCIVSDHPDTPKASKASHGQIGVREKQKQKCITFIPLRPANLLKNIPKALKNKD